MAGGAGLLAGGLLIVTPTARSAPRLLTFTARDPSVPLPASGNFDSDGPVLSANGRYMAFLSDATNLVAGDTNGIRDVFVRDLLSQTTSLVSVGATNPSILALSTAEPRITPDGRYVAFSSGALGLVPAVPASAYGEVYLRDLVANTTLWASSNAAAIALPLLGPGPLNSSHPVLSDDGRYVAFSTSLSNAFIVTNSTVALILRHDTVARTTTLVSSNAVGILTNCSVHLWDGQSGTDTRVSANAGQLQTNSLSHTPLLSADGRYVAFSSPGAGFVAADSNRARDVFVRDLAAAATDLISRRDPTLIPQTGDGLASLSSGCVSADGRWVAYASAADDLIALDTNAATDVFARDLVSGTNILVSVGLDGQPAQGGFSTRPTVIAGGRSVAFLSSATNLVAGVTATNVNLYLRDLQAGTTSLLSVETDGVSPVAGDCWSPAFSQDGRYVTFLNSIKLAGGHQPGSAPSGGAWAGNKSSPFFLHTEPRQGLFSLRF